MSDMDVAGPASPPTQHALTAHPRQPSGPRGWGLAGLVATPVGVRPRAALLAVLYGTPGA